MELNLRGEFVLVTGATANIGRAIALGFAAEGAELGAQGVGLQLFDDDESRVAANLAALCEQASRLGLRVSVEFMPSQPVG